MAPLSNPRLSLSQSLALLEDPTPIDFDPEAPEDYENPDNDDDAGSSNGSLQGGSDDDENKGREHYVSVGKSKLRKQGLGPVLLDPKYDGARVSRDEVYDSDDDEDEDEELEAASGDDGDGEELSVDGILDDEDEDIDSDAALGSDEERFAGFKFLGSSTTVGGVKPGRGAKVVGSDEESLEDKDSDEKMDEDSGSGSELGSEDDDDNDEGSIDDEDEESDGSEGGRENEAARRAELKKMMAQEQKNVVASLSKAAQADIEKGIAVRQQQTTFDSFLSIRIKLQKALIATNSLPSGGVEQPTATEEDGDSWKAAEGAALKLWNIISDLRSKISESRGSSNNKRKHEEINQETTIDEIWTKTQRLEQEATPWREATLEKWSSKAAGVSTVSVNKKLNNTTTTQGFTAAIRETLADSERLVKRTRIPRSCAPIQAAQNVVEDVEVFDDTDFYQQLLKALVDQRMVDSSIGGGSANGSIRWAMAMRDAKKKKVVDTRASKGRKMKYHVHEKLQNFMAPIPNLAWHENQIDELFSSLLGQRVRVHEEDGGSDEESDVPDDGLRLFRS